MKENFENIRNQIAQAAARVGRSSGEVSLVAVSKRVPVERIELASEYGQTIFAENYLQEAQEKIRVINKSIEWHFIGHFQSNKAKHIAELFDVVETIDRLKVAQALEVRLAQLNKIMPVYVQVNIGREKQKGGVLPADAGSLVRQLSDLPHLAFTGLMAMPPYFDDPEKSRPYYKEMRLLAEGLIEKGIHGENGKIALSMGMSGDYQVAIEEGATLVRVGTALFGAR